MKTIIRLTLLGSVLAKTPINIDSIVQRPLLPQDACPSDSVLQNEDLQPTAYSPFGADAPALSFRANLTRTLDESRTAASQINDYPWTFFPECFSNSNLSEPFCVYSDENFASGRGIVLVTTKSLAYSIRQKPAFTNPSVLATTNDYANPPYAQHDMPGKGRGLVATRPLERGSQIFASTPLFITDQDLDLLSTPDLLSLLYRGVSTLPASSQKGFWKLTPHFTTDQVLDRILTNSFEVAINDQSHQALFPEIALLNHDCRPNAAYFWDQATLTHYVHATRAILPGEELTITYTNNERNRHTRVDQLKRNWGFDCACAACTAHPHLVSESDARLHQISDLAAILDDWTATSRATPDVALAMVSLYEQERLWANLATAYKYAAETYASFGDRWGAIKYARLGVEMGMLNRGWGDRDVKEMRNMADRPEMSWSWGKRVGLGKRNEWACRH